MKLKSVCVYCGSADGLLLDYQLAAVSLGKLLAQNNITLVYGGGHVGLMGMIADSVLQNNGKVIGIIPDFLYRKEVAHLEVTELKVVKTMHERKQEMANLADAFIAMPGGIGTLEELVEILTWNKLRIQKKPCGILNVKNYFDHFIALLNFMTEQKFLQQEGLELFVENSPQELLTKLDNNI